jgi:hypothetical protein
MPEENVDNVNKAARLSTSNRRYTMKKSRYQMTNRGRKGKPLWYVEDMQGADGSYGKCLYTSRTKYLADTLQKAF